VPDMPTIYLFGVCGIGYEVLQGAPDAPSHIAYQLLHCLSVLERL